MKQNLLFSLILLGALLVPGFSRAQTAPLQAKPIFPFFSSEKTPESTTPPETQSQSEITEGTLDLVTLKDQPLPIRRKMVASELDTIALRLSVLADKTKTASLLLADNGIDTAPSQTELAKATLSLAQARLLIDTLLVSANDPTNETVVTLLIDTVPFKDVVIQTENELRASRTAIITALGLLKSAVTPIPAVPAQ